MATVRFSRGHWVADYCGTNKRRRIERPKGHFENLTDELRAAQALLADRVAEVADGLVHEGQRNLRRRSDSMAQQQGCDRPSTRRIYQQLLVGYFIPYFGGRTLRLIQVTDIERFRTELSTGIPDSIKQALYQQGVDRPQHGFQLCDAQSMGGAKSRQVCGAGSIPAAVEERPLDMDVLTPANQRLNGGQGWN
ncbi:MAG: hypothetical protein WDM77_16375 [Steroidobacteraceae bacterium]